MRPHFHFHFYLYLLFLLSSCVKDKPYPAVKSVPIPGTKGILALNEGSYGNNNADLSFISFSTGEVSNHIYKTANNKSLGDVAQNITFINGQYYICVNNSSKIVIVDPFLLTSIHSIENINFPRYLLQISADIAYISSLYLPHVYVLQVSTNTVIDTIQTDFPNTETMLLLNNQVWICNWDTACNYLYQVNANTHELLNKIQIQGHAPHDIVLDKNGMIWVLSGNTYKNKKSYLTCLNPANNSQIKSIAFEIGQDPIRLTMNAKRDTLYYINVNYNGQATNNGLYRMSIDDNTLPAMPMIQAPSNTYFWAIGIDSSTSNIYLSDPKGFTQSSTVYKYSPSGALLNAFQTGIGTNQFIFK